MSKGPKPTHDHDAESILASRIAQALAVVHLIKTAVSDECTSKPSNDILGDAAWAVDELLEQAAAANKKLMDSVYRD